MDSFVTTMFLFLCAGSFEVSFADSKRRPESHISASDGHYPYLFCKISNVILDSPNEVFKYKISGEKTDNNSFKKHCNSLDNIWKIENAAIPDSIICNETYEEAYVFTMYYHYGSNYYHLHSDMMIPLFSLLHYQKSKKNKNIVLMPSVESKRLEIINWETPAFSDKSTYWMQMLKVLAKPFHLKPLNRSIFNKETLCLKSAYFGTPRVNFQDEELMMSYVRFIMKELQVTPGKPKSNRVGLISRSGRRRILNEKELVTAVSKIVDIDLVEFSGMTFKEQVEVVQKYTVLVGMNGAGLTNGLFRPFGSVAIQLVPYDSGLLIITFEELLGLIGPYLEWHNTHFNMTRQFPGDHYNNLSDTTVHVEEFVDLIKQALKLGTNKSYSKKVEL